MNYTLIITRSSLLTPMTSAMNVISLISRGAVVSLPLVRVRVGHDDAWKTGTNEESISLKQGLKGKHF